eukprot:scaffold3857_cov127-Cylindrotheca_fusiformis.AAC.4
MKCLARHDPALETALPLCAGACMPQAVHDYCVQKLSFEGARATSTRSFWHGCQKGDHTHKESGRLP